MRNSDAVAYHTLTAATGNRRRQKMVVSAASVLNASGFPVASSRGRVCQLHSSFLINVRNQQHVSVACSAKFPGMQNFRDPTKLIVFFNYTKDKLWESVPGSVKDFPWKKAENVTLHELQVLGKETLKWSLLVYFAFSSLSDIIYSISRNKELVIPFGLFIGCLMANYFDEIYHELMHDHKDGPVNRRIVGVSCFFLLVKVIAGGNDFLLHIANGGLMQAIWNWKKSSKLDEENSSWEDAPTPTNTDG